MGFDTIEINLFISCRTISARSSSVHQNNNENWGPKYAIDGKISNTISHFFHSMNERFPWLEITMKTQEVNGVRLVTRLHISNNLEIRAGMTRVPESQTKKKARLRVNKMVAKFKEPVDPLPAYEIFFPRKIRAKYITLQVIGHAALDVNEVAPITTYGDEECQNVPSDGINEGLSYTIRECASIITAGFAKFWTPLNKGL